jgi:hypothetical protein
MKKKRVGKPLNKPHIPPERFIGDLKSTLKHLEKDIPAELMYLKKHVDKLWEYSTQAGDRLQDLEIQVNLLTRLLTTLCLENMGIRLSALRKLIRRIEKEAVADSQVSELEKWFRLEHRQSSSPDNPSKSGLE